MSKIKIQDRLAEYFAGLISIQDFADWLAKESASLRADNDEELFNLVASLLNSLDVYFDGHISRFMLRSELAPFAGRKEFEQKVLFAEPRPHHDPLFISAQSRGQLQSGQLAVAV